MNKFLSRKFLVFIVGTLLIWFGKIDGNIWLALALGYISINTLHRYLGGKLGK